MSGLASLFKSSLGKKYVMAVTGILLFLFVVGHLVGNLQVFGPPELINNYAHFLQSKPALVWSARLGLLAVVVLHIVSAAQLTVMNREARPVQYAVPSTQYGSTVYSRYMLLSGLVVLAFILYHLAHFTVLMPGINGVGDFRKLETTLDGGVKAHDVYAMMILGFRVWWVSLFYIIAQGLLFMHLRHGLGSMFQSLGLRNHTWLEPIRTFAQFASIAILIGYTIIPMAIYMGLGREYAEEKRHELAGHVVTKEAGKEGGH
jgi:succinate dehydrogenase / fumarate reductase cytochrome b subunit